MKNLFIIGGLIFVQFAHAQSHYTTSGYPELNKRLPDFSLKDVRHYKTKNATLSEFRGKWLIIDFWHRYCTTCIKALPKVDSLQKEFSDLVQFLLVGYTGSQYMNGQADDKLIKQDFEKYRQRFNLNLPIAFDSTLFHRFKIHGAPYIIVVNPEGIVKGITWRFDRSDLVQFLQGETPRLPKAWRKEENTVKYDEKLPFLINGNGGYDTDYLYRSLLSPYKEYMDGDSRFKIVDNKLQIIGVGLRTLYKYAYRAYDWISASDKRYGEFFPDVVLETSEQSIFSADPDLRDNMYCYSLQVPAAKADTVTMMRMMQRDLQNYFGYDVTIQKRRMPIWKLVRLGKNLSSDSASLQNGKMFRSAELLIKNIAQQSKTPYVLINGISKDEALDIEVDMSDWATINASMNKQGYYFIKDEKEMKVIVIRDPKEQ